MDGAGGLGPEWALMSSASKASSSLLAALESLRLEFDEVGQVGTVWALALLQRLASAFDLGTPEHLRVHALILSAMSDPDDRGPSAAASLAYSVHHDEVTPK